MRALGDMSDPAGPNVLDLGPKFVSAERALAAIRAGTRIYVGTGCAAPRGLLAKLEAMVGEEAEARARDYRDALKGGRLRTRIADAKVARSEQGGRVIRFPR